MKTLIILTHPGIQNSVINKRLLQEALKEPQHFSVHDLTQVYGGESIDAAHEQELIRAHNALVLQFPLHNFSCPPILKSWIDAVMTHGFAYGRGSDGIAGRKVALAVTAGIKKSDYCPQGRYHFSLREVLTPFELAFNTIFAPTTAAFSHFTAPRRLRAWTTFQAKTI
ncbi:NAD(P)H-dependent oxidoreductase [uncultured Campylobacter sp.]|uniref:NAD(P)H-dependent oxidoreductase n=1 Tax=uncultured Campylobacter sp. TaxID=218934 RepID=UPI002628DC15|nr:NAD(P)H-dependent oxidoreductase [uncultured Campylobacter sp.]